ncbi:Conserved_hypothetical protein [Hexamita inflata]|uniref:Uncharacterized protein n=1 Tax=Hexamita inflata TaxID=28002 RepID=A0AA86QEY9_9EUKA|nr:Conserved hypothetical protein [Hexamita inflata]
MLLLAISMSLDACTSLTTNLPCQLSSKTANLQLSLSGALGVASDATFLFFLEDNFDYTPFLLNLSITLSPASGLPIFSTQSASPTSPKINGSITGLQTCPTILPYQNNGKTQCISASLCASGIVDSAKVCQDASAVCTSFTVVEANILQCNAADCAQPFFLMNNNKKICLDSCASGILSGQQCFSTIPDCKVVSQATTDCLSTGCPVLNLAGTCATSCEATEYLLLSTLTFLMKCVSACAVFTQDSLSQKICLNSNSTCTALIMRDQVAECVSACPIPVFVVQDKWQICTEKCPVDSPYADGALNKCVQVCPKFVLNDICADSCPSKIYILENQNKKCKASNEFCKLIPMGNDVYLCSDKCELYYENNAVGDVCTSTCSATNPYIEEDGKCSASCSQGVFDAQKKCQSADQVKNCKALIPDSGALLCTDACNSIYPFLSVEGNMNKCLKVCSSQVYDQTNTCLPSADNCNLIQLTTVESLPGAQCLEVCSGVNKFYQTQTYTGPGAQKDNQLMCVSECSTKTYNEQFKCIAADSTCPSYITDAAGGKKCLTICADPVNIYTSYTNGVASCVMSCPSTYFQTQPEQTLSDGTKVTVKLCIDETQARYCGGIVENQPQFYECVPQCPVSSVFINFVGGIKYCVDKCANQFYYENLTCLDTCASPYFTRQINGQRECVKSCIPFMEMTSGNNCVKRCDDLMINITVGAVQNLTCVASCKRFDEVSRMCLSDDVVCPLTRTTAQGIACVTRCLPGEVNDDSVCVAACPKTKYTYNGICVTTCPSNVYNNTDMTCVASVKSCAYFTVVNGQNLCHSNITLCDQYIERGQCVQKCSASNIALNKQCTYQCGNNYPFIIDGKCQPTCDTNLTVVRLGGQTIASQKYKEQIIDGQLLVLDNTTKLTNVYLDEILELPEMKLITTGKNFDVKGFRNLTRECYGSLSLTTCPYFRTNLKNTKYESTANITLFECLDSCDQYLSGKECVSVCLPTEFIEGNKCVSACSTKVFKKVQLDNFLPNNYTQLCLLPQELYQCKFYSTDAVTGISECLEMCSGKVNGSQCIPDCTPSLNKICVSSCKESDQGVCQLSTFCPNKIKVAFGQATCQDSCLSLTQGNQCVDKCAPQNDPATCAIVTPCASGTFDETTGQCLTDTTYCSFIKTDVTDGRKSCAEYCPKYANGKDCVDACPADLYLNIDRQCVKKCPSGYFQKIANADTTFTLTCLVNAQACMIQGFYLSSSAAGYECVDKCAVAALNGFCAATCGSQFIQDGQCVARCRSNIYTINAANNNECVVAAAGKPYKWDGVMYQQVSYCALQEKQICKDYCDPPLIKLSGTCKSVQCNTSQVYKFFEAPSCVEKCGSNIFYNVTNECTFSIQQCLFYEITSVTTGDKTVNTYNCTEYCNDFVNGKSCVKSCGTLYLEDKQCVAKCSGTQMSVQTALGKQCISDCSRSNLTNPLIQLNECVTTCTNNMVQVNTTHCDTACTGGMVVVDGICKALDSCPNLSYTDRYGNTVCQDSCPDGTFQYQGSCFANCPDGTELKGTSCKKSFPMKTFAIAAVGAVIVLCIVGIIVACGSGQIRKASQNVQKKAAASKGQTSVKQAPSYTNAPQKTTAKPAGKQPVKKSTKKIGGVQ